MGQADGGALGLANWVRETWDGGLDRDGLYMHVGSRAGTREYVARRDGDMCEVGALGNGACPVDEHRVMPWETFDEKVMSQVLPVDWLPYYVGGGDAGDWSLVVRWNGQFLVRSGGRGGGPAGYEMLLHRVEAAICPLLGLRPL